MNAPLDILALSPHPDDAEIGCGGSLILAADRGLRVAVADLSNGEMSSRGTPALRLEEKQRAADLLGLCLRLSLNLPDSAIGTDPAHRLSIIELLRATRPRVVLAPYWSDRHPDHAATGKLVREACFFAGVSKVGTGIPYRPEQVYYYMMHEPMTPSFVMDISAVWSRKRMALTAYQSQFGAEASERVTAISGPDFLHFVETRDNWFGTMVGATYGEPFISYGPLIFQHFPNLDGPRLPIGELPPYTMYC